MCKCGAKHFFPVGLLFVLGERELILLHHLRKGPGRFLGETNHLNHKVFYKNN